MPELEQIVETYADREDRGRAVSGSAAVAMVLREGPHGVEALFIERARRDGDPWSGQMAFPGGRWEPSDESLRETAARETLEELSVDLSQSPYLGYLGEVTGAGRAVQVSGYLYHWQGPAPELRPNEEVAAALWLPLRALRDPRRFTHYRVPYAPRENFNGLLIDGVHGEVELDRPGGPRVLWGLTLRLVREFHERLGFEFPVKPEEIPVVGYGV
ncbi:MAG: CoA pyrophosphatase [Acidobacteriota bacterium]